MLNTENMNMKELKEIANSFDIEFKGNISKINLRKKVDAFLNKKKENTIEKIEVKKEGIVPNAIMEFGDKGRLGDKNPRFLKWLRDNDPDTFEEKYADYVRRWNIKLDEEDK
jgi:hypothetical protein